VRRIGRAEITLLLLAVLLLGSYFRFVGLDWGEGQHIHPDEEFLRQVTAAVRLPEHLDLYLNTANSPLNPYNQGHGFFVYGTLPLFLTRAVAEGLEHGCGEVSMGPLHPARVAAPLLLGVPAEACRPGSFTGSRMVGRALAALFDVATILFVFLTGRRLHGPEVGLLGSLLYALAVLPIQQSHFYTVDAFTTLFVAMTMYLTLRATQTGGWGAFTMAGLTTGLGMACKISVWPLGLLVGLGALLWWWREGRGEDGMSNPPPAQQVLEPADQVGDPAPVPQTLQPTGKTDDPASSPPSFLAVAGRVALAGGVALVAFRLAQPYAFMGPGLFGLQPNPLWLENMAEIRRLMSGAVDTYPGHQWTARPPILFPWINMVFWGLGLPLGLFAWLAWGAGGLKIVRWWRTARGEEVNVHLAALLLWAWASGYFLYQGTQWVKSNRYFLPVYPAFLLLAAWLMVRWVRRTRSGWRPRPVRAATVGAVAVVLLGTLCWALASTSIYTRSHTRVAASRWIFENVPSAATVQLDVAGGTRSVNVPLQPDIVSSDAGSRAAPFEVPEEGNLDSVNLNYVLDPNDDPQPEMVRVAVAADAAQEMVLAEAIAVIDPPPTGRGQAYEFSLEPARLLAGNTYYLVVEALDGSSVQLLTSVLATEHWDWAPPLRVDGRDPFGGMYRGLSGGELGLYFDDTLEKRENLLDGLDEADYIITASNRLYASIPRLPTRYPLTIAYYEALFSGELGFELAADFTSFMALGPLQFPDQEEPFPVRPARFQYRAAPIDVPMPPAAEAFSVYDHPRVLVFRKTSAYSRPRAEALLPASLLDDVIWVTPRQATRGAREAIFDLQTWQQQQAGGTWSQIFDRQSLPNRSDVLAATVWYLVAALLGVVAFPLLFTALPSLSDRGYGLARAVGLLLAGYATWLAASLRLLPNTRGTMVVVLVLLAALGGVLTWRRRRALRDFLRLRWPVLLTYEALFLVLFAAWCWVRSLNPDLWHPIVGGEKPMDFAYFNAIIKSTWFPPYDPWFAGGYINYYYFGFVLVGTLTKLTGIMPSIAYNLALALFYALTGGVAFSVAFNLLDRSDRPSWRPYAAGLLAVLFVLVLGNLGDLRLLVKGLRALGAETTFPSTIPGLPELVQLARGLVLVMRGASLPFRPEAPYWEPTRMIPADASGVGPITEFPAFSFLYGDLHAHLLALPYTLVSIALVLNWARGGHRWRLGGVPSLLLGGLVIGSLRAMNTWDYPTYLSLGLLGLALGVALEGGGGQIQTAWRDLWSLVWRALLLVGLTWLLFLPYTHNYVSAYTRLRAWQDQRTSLLVYVLLLAHFLFPLFTLLLVDLWRAFREPLPAANEDGAPTALTARLGLLAAVVGALFMSAAVALLGVPVAFIALPGVALAGGLALADRTPTARRFVYLALALALALTLGVELVVLEGDIGRMNTVFKFYFQAWSLLAIASGAALVWLDERLQQWPESLRQIWWTVMALLVAATALFPLLSIPAKTEDRLSDATGPTLDGMAYMQFSRVGDVRGEVDVAPDYQAIVWLQDNVFGSPVILEGLGEREYLWSNRYSIYTGLPTVVGWNWHQRQQRAAAGAGEVEQRRRDVNELYWTSDLARARDILEQYDVRYVIVGPYERLYYEPPGLAKFETMVTSAVLDVAYDQRGVTIYRVLQ